MLLEQDYLIGMVRAFDQALDAETLLQKIDPERPLAEGARENPESRTAARPVESTWASEADPDMGGTRPRIIETAVNVSAVAGVSFSVTSR